MVAPVRTPPATRSCLRLPGWRRIAAALLVVTVLLTGAPASAQPTAAYGYDLVPTYWGTTKLGHIIMRYRANHPEVTGATNVAAFEVQPPTGPPFYVAAASVNTAAGRSDGTVDIYSDLDGTPTTVTVPGMGNKHAEEVVAAYLKQQPAAGGRTQADEVIEGESELEPCPGTPSKARPARPASRSGSGSFRRQRQYARTMARSISSTRR